MLNVGVFLRKLLNSLLKKCKKPSPEGYFHAERQFFLSFCTPSHSYKTIKKKVDTYEGSQILGGDTICDDANNANMSHTNRMGSFPLI